MATLFITLFSLLALTRLVFGVNWAATARVSRSAIGAMRTAIPMSAPARAFRRADHAANANYVMMPGESECGLPGQTFRIQKAS